MSATARVQVGHYRYRVIGVRGTPVAEGDFESPEMLAELLEGALEPVRRARWELEVGRPWAQVRHLHDLPPVKDRHLTGLVRSEHGRYFRARPGDIHVEARRGSEGDVVGVAVDAWLPAAVSGAARLGGGGLVEATVVDAEDARHPVTPSEVRRDRRRLASRTLGAWMPIAIVPWLVAASFYAADLHHDLQTLEAGQRELASRERELSQIKSDLGRAGRIVESVRRTGRGSAWALPLLASLARDLPLTTSLISLSAERRGPCAIELAGDTTGIGAALAGVEEPVVEGRVVTAAGCR